MTVFLHLTPAERAALLTFLSDYMQRCPNYIEVSIDIPSMEEVRVEDLLAKIMDAPVGEGY